MPAVLTSHETRVPKAHPAAETVASLHNITKRYGNGVMALDGLSLELRRGEIVALLGPNGAGKSTAVKLMMGLSTPTTGAVRIFGVPPTEMAARLRTGVMLQVGRAPEMLRVSEHINIFRGYYLNPMPYTDLVRAAGLEGIEKRKFGELSGGQKQRVLFAIALAGDPDLIFLDEPTVGLDIEARRGMWKQIRELAARGKTVLLTTHYLEEADALAHRIVVINKGRVVCEGTPAEVKSMGARGGVTAVTENASADAGRSLKIIRCATTLKREHLLAMPGVSAVEFVTGESALESDRPLVTVVSAQPEATLREMLALDLHLHSLDVQSPALEDAFLALTAKE
jgi:ABC-2 type transport system ATP-binding protein